MNKKKTARELIEMEVMEISLVDRPAFQEAKFLLTKRKTKSNTRNEKFEILIDRLEKYIDKEDDEKKINMYASDITSEIMKGLENGSIIPEQVESILLRYAEKLRELQIYDDIEKNFIEVIKTAIDENSEFEKSEGGDDGTFRFDFKFSKVNNDEQLVGGILYGVRDFSDIQGDFVRNIEVLRRASENFMLKSQTIRVMHSNKVLSSGMRIIENIVFSKTTEHLGVTIPAQSWWILIKILDKRVWELIRNGTLQGFSLGGKAKGRRVEVAA